MKPTYARASERNQSFSRLSLISRTTIATFVLASALMLLNACGLIGSNGSGTSGPGGGSQLTVATPTLATATQGTSYSATLSATGGTAPYSWSATGLPAGITLSSSGTIMGTPTASGSFSITIKVTDAAAKSASSTLTLVVVASGPLAVITSAMPVGTVNSGYSMLLIAAGGAPPYKWALASGSLPPGLSLNGSTGLVSGTASGTTGSYSFTVQVTDAASATHSQSLTIVIAASLTIPALVPGSDLQVTSGTDELGDNTIVVKAPGYFAVKLSDGSKVTNGPTHTGLDGFWDLKNDPNMSYDMAGSDAGMLSKDFGYPPTTLNSSGMGEAKPGGGTIQILEQNSVRAVLEFDWPVRPYGNNSYPIDPSLNGKEIWTIYRPGKIYERFSFTNNTTQAINMGGSTCLSGQACYFQYNFHTSWTKFDGEGPYYDSGYWVTLGTNVPQVGSPWGYQNDVGNQTPASLMLHSTAGGFSQDIPPNHPITPGIVEPVGTTTTIPIRANFLEIPYDDSSAYTAYKGQLFAGMRSKLQVGFNVPPGTDSLVRHLVLHAGDNGIVDPTTAMIYAAEYRNRPSLTMTVGSINTAGGAQTSGFNPDRGCYEITASNNSVDFTISGTLYNPAFNISSWSTVEPATIRINGTTANLNTDYVAVADSGRLLIQIMKALPGVPHIQIP